jgi:tetratricopeptide (TPR) repeat protein
VAESPSSKQDPNSAESQRNGGVNIAGPVNVGGDVVGRDKIIIQQPLDKRFWVVMAAIAVVIVIGLGVAIAVRTQLPPMPNGFNIAVAQFAMQDVNGLLKVTDESKELSDYLFSAINNETDQLDPALGINLRKPDDIGMVSGMDRNSRAAKAKELANWHNATILIYGVVTANGDSYRVEPEFYVAGDSWNFGSEVAGPTQLGQPVPFKPPLSGPHTSVEINKELNTRTKALQHIVKGLASFFIGEFESARGEFSQAANMRDWQDGKEVAYLLEGAAQLRLYDANDDPEKRDAELQNASDAFEKACQQNPRYARCYLGLGSVAIQRAVSNLQSGLLDEGRLIEAYKWYSMSLSAPEQVASAYVPLKAEYGLGQIHLLGYEAGLTGWSSDQARFYFEQIITEFDKSHATDLAWFAGHAHAYLGRLSKLGEDWQLMSDEYHRATDILSARPFNRNPPRNWIARYWAWIGFAEEKLNQLDAARNAYEEAINNGMGIVSDEEIQQWQATLTRLK